MATTVNISSYSGSVSAGDWSPAMTAAWNAIKATGGTINIDTAITLKTGTDFSQSDNYVSVLIKGDLGATVTIQATTTSASFQFGNQNQVKFQDIVFLGNTGQVQTADVGQVITAGYVDNVIVDNCQFLGIAATYALIRATTSAQLNISNCYFGGCGGTHIESDGSRGLTVTNCQAFDYGNYQSSYYDRQFGRTQWINAVNAPASNSAFLPYIRIQGFRGDEGSSKQININGYPRVAISQSSANISVGGSGINLTSVANASIDQYWIGYNASNRPSLVLADCGYVSVDGLQIHNGDHPITIDSSRVVINAAVSASDVLTAPIASGTIERLTITDSPDVTTTCDPGYGAITTFQNTTEVVPTR